ncbi:MAG: FHA domain-containing protein, partial [Planctomycetota bacterium]
MDMLVVVQGSHRGQRYPLEDGRLVLGRDRRCDIPLDDDGVSRRHAAVYREDDALMVEDLGSTNGTYVNSLCIEAPHALAHGDRLAVGDTVMLVEIDNPYSTAQRAVVADTLRQSDSVMKFSLDSTSIMELMGAEAKEEERPSDTGQQAFLALYNFITRVSGILDRETLLERGIQEMARVCKADRGAVLLLDRKAQLVPRATYAASGDGQVAVSRTLLEEVLTYREGVLSREPAKDDRFRHTQALDMNVVTSMMGVPLVVQDKPLGVIYLDTSGIGQPFDEHSVRLASAMTMELAICLENANLYAMLKDSEEFSACVLRSLAGGLLVVDRDGRIHRTNPIGAALAGLTENDLLGMRLDAIDPLSEINILVGQTLRSGKPQETESAHLRPGGEAAPVPVGVNTAPLMDYAGNPIGVVVHYRDLSRVHELGEQVKRAERL